MTVEKKPAPKGKERRRVDWDAVERDYRTGSFTLRELAAKYGGSHQAIAKQAKVKGWTQDLTKAVRAATNARLIEKAVAEKVAESGQQVANAVLAVAEANTQVILKHRQRLESLVGDAEAARAKLVEMIGSVADVREAATLVGAIESLSRTTKNIIDKEREAFNLDSKEKPPAEGDDSTMGNVEAANRIAFILANAKGRAAS